CRARRPDAPVQLRRARGAGGRMGVIKELLLLPLAPVRGTVWIAEQLAEEAERQLDPGLAVRRSLGELEERYARGEIDEQEHDRLEDELLQALTTTTP